MEIWTQSSEALWPLLILVYRQISLKTCQNIQNHFQQIFLQPCIQNITKLFLNPTTSRVGVPLSGLSIMTSMGCPKHPVYTGWEDFKMVNIYVHVGWRYCNDIPSKNRWLFSFQPRISRVHHPFSVFPLLIEVTVDLVMVFWAAHSTHHSWRTWKGVEVFRNGKKKWNKKQHERIVQDVPSRELTYPTWGKGKSSSKVPFYGIC